MGEWAWAAGIAPLLGPWRLGAVQYVYQREGGFDPHKQLDFLSRHRVSHVFTTPTAMRAMMAVDDAGERYPQGFHVVCSAGEPLNPEAIRWFREQYGVTVLDYYGLTESYPLCANYPFMEVREGSMGRPMPGWDIQILDEDENPVAQGERGEICLRARSNPHYPLGYWNLPEASEETFGGDWFHTKDAATMDEDGYYWYSGRADDVIIAAGYRIGPFEVESACIEHPAVREAAAVASPDEVKGNVVKAFIVLAEGHEPSYELADEIKRFVRERLSAYAYPRRVEFVAELPKTLTGKIRRIELREAERERARIGWRRGHQSRAGDGDDPPALRRPRWPPGTPCQGRDLRRDLHRDPGARELTRAAHMGGAPTPASVRFSNGGGDPTVPDYVARRPRPRGRFQLPDGSRTDIASQTLPSYPFPDQEGFLATLEVSRPSLGALLKLPGFALRYPRAIAKLPRPSGSWAAARASPPAPTTPSTPTSGSTRTAASASSAIAGCPPSTSPRSRRARPSAAARTGSSTTSPSASRAGRFGWSSR